VIGANANRSAATRDYPATFPAATTSADDDPVQRRLLETLVHQLGYQAETVESGEAARPLRAQNAIIVIVFQKGAMALVAAV
jgi:DNA-binding NtrC family response regulator